VMVTLRVAPDISGETRHGTAHDTLHVGDASPFEDTTRVVGFLRFAGRDGDGRGKITGNDGWTPGDRITIVRPL
jgi:hypothetical protein